MSRQEQEGRGAETRNGKLRKLTNKYVNYGVRQLHEAFPNLTPNQVTVIGNLLVAGTAIHAAIENEGSETSFKKRLLTLVEILAASATDRIDGELATITDNKTPLGAQLDAASDRIQEAYLGFSRMHVAHERGDRLGVGLAAVSTISNVLPSLIRARAESRGVVVPEDGKGFVQFFGTRLGRTITASLGTAFSELQKPSELINITANTATSVGRVSAMIGPGEEQNSPSEDERAEARDKFRTLALTSLGIGVMTAGAYHYLNSNKS